MLSGDRCAVIVKATTKYLQLLIRHSFTYRNMTEGEYQSQMAQIGQRLRNIMEGVGSVELMYGSVISVDKKKNTINARIGSENALVIEDISLSTLQGVDASVILYPTINTTVVLGLPYKQPENAFVLAFGLVDSISIKTAPYSCVFSKENISLSCENGASMLMQDGNITMNGGDLGGLVVIQKLTDRLNKLQQELTNFKNAYNSHKNGTYPLATPFIGSFSTFANDDYENKNVQQ